MVAQIHAEVNNNHIADGDEVGTAFRDLFFIRHDAYGTLAPPNQILCVKEPVTLDVVKLHLAGVRRISAYSTTLGDSCIWGCLDIDHTGHKKKLSFDEAQNLYDLGPAIVQKAAEYGIPAYLERSKRGGWHLWVFAQSPISAALMRRVLRTLLGACGFPVPANASKTGPKDAIEIFPMQDTIGIGYGNPVFVPYFGGDPLGMTVFVQPDHPELKAFSITDFLAQVQTALPALLAEVGEMARAPQRQHNGHATAHTPPTVDEDAAALLARLSSKCARFKDALAVQEQDGAEEPEWFNWIHTLTTAGYAEAARTFSQLSNKHDRRSGSRLLMCERDLAAGTAKPPVRCTTFGCDEEQIRACFSGLVFKKEDGLSNNPVVHLRETYSDNNAPPPPEPEWPPFEEDGREQDGSHPEPDGQEENGKPKLKLGEFRIRVRCAADIEPEEVNYLWYPYFPLGKLGILGGDSGIGKSYLTSAIATSFSLGRWPFFLNGKESVREPGTTIIFSAEDGVADTYVPRLINLGADRSRIHFGEGKEDWKGNLHHVVLNDKHAITHAIQDYGAQFVVFDPLQSFLPRGTKMNEMETVRPVLDALIEAATMTHAFILLAGHLSKARQDTASYKFLGSVDWFNAARTAMLAVKNPDKPDTERFFYHVKNSLGPTAPGMGFSIAADNEPIFMWGKTADVSIEDVLSGNAKQGHKEEDAKEFLKGELAEGAQTVECLREAAKKVRIAWRTIERAKSQLKIRAHKDGFQGPWVWELPGTK